MKISVIITAYNGVATLARAIDSVLAQSYRADEIIVVDDGSTDATSEVAKIYDEVSLLRQKRMGLSAARNNGVMMAANEWIAFLNADDTWHPQKLDEQAAYHRKNRSCKASITDAKRMTGGGEEALSDKSRTTGAVSFETCVTECSVTLSSLLVQKKLLERLEGFDESMELCEEYDLLLRLLLDEKVARIDRILVYSSGDLDDTRSAVHSDRERFRIKALEKHLDTPFDSAVRKVLIEKYRALAEDAKQEQEAERLSRYTARLEQLESGF